MATQTSIVYTAANQPTTGETARFGSNIFTFLTVTTRDPNNPLHVLIAGSTDATYANLVTAVNRFENQFVLTYSGGTLTITMGLQTAKAIEQVQFADSASDTRPFDVSGVSNLTHTSTVTGTGTTPRPGATVKPAFV